MSKEKNEKVEKEVISKEEVIKTRDELMRQLEQIKGMIAACNVLIGKAKKVRISEEK